MIRLLAGNLCCIGMSKDNGQTNLLIDTSNSKKKKICVDTGFYKNC